MVEVINNGVIVKVVAEDMDGALVTLGVRSARLRNEPSGANVQMLRPQMPGLRVDPLISDVEALGVCMLRQPWFENVTGTTSDRAKTLFRGISPTAVNPRMVMKCYRFADDVTAIRAAFDKAGCQMPKVVVRPMLRRVLHALLLT